MIFIDTGPLVGRHLKRDPYRDLALAGWRRLEESGHRCLTSNFVLDEAFTLLGRRASYAFAAERARALLVSEVLEILRPDAEDELAALTAFEKFADQKVSFTDCLSFALMRRHRVERAFSFDRHFLHAGFELWPDPAGWINEPEPPAYGEG